MNNEIILAKGLGCMTRKQARQLLAERLGDLVVYVHNNDYAGALSSISESSVIQSLLNALQTKDHLTLINGQYVIDINSLIGGVQ